jgi:uncharacterized protein YfaS (alpha-2-macroglobulin family)
VPPAAASPAGDNAFAFQRLTLDKSEACVHFSTPLDTAVDYTGFLDVRPAAKPSIRVVGNSLCLAGLPEKNTLTLLKNLPDLQKNNLGRDVALVIDKKDTAEDISFVNKGFILPSTNSDGVVLTVNNVKTVGIDVIRVGERMLISEFREEFGNTGLSTWDIRRIINNNGAIIWSGSIDVPQSNTKTTVAFPLSKAIKERKPGVYLILAYKDKSERLKPSEFKDGEEYDYEEDYSSHSGDSIPVQWVVETDLALTSYQGDDGLTVMVRSLSTAMPKSGVSLKLIGRNNDILAEAVSDAEGLVRFSAPFMAGKGGNTPEAVFAFAPAKEGTPEDFTALSLLRPGFDLSDRGVDGRKSPPPIDAFLYSDRGIYRPGETIHLTALVRDRSSVAIADQAFLFEILQPDGTVWATRNHVTENQGAASADITLPKNARRGLWRINAKLHPGSDPSGTLVIDVQDFVPQKLKLTAEASDKRPDTTSPITVRLQSDFLYGAPGADLTTEVIGRLIPDDQPFPAAKGWIFGKFDEDIKPADLTFDSTNTDASGLAEASLSPDALAAARTPFRPMKLEVRASVFEPGGRPVSSSFDIPLITRPQWLAIHQAGEGGWIPESTPYELKIAAFDATGNRIAAQNVRWRLIREYWNYNWFSRSGRWDYTVSISERPLTTGIGNTGPAADLLVPVNLDWGRYRLEIVDEKGNVQTSYRFRAGWGSTQEESDSPDKLTVEVDKPGYKAGETARVKITPPAAGQVQIMIAGTRIHRAITRDIPAEGAVVEIPVDAAWDTGAYALVSYLRPVSTARPGEPVRAVGVGWLGIDPQAKKLEVALSLPASIRPETTLTVPVRIDGVQPGEEVFLTLAAVDEGVLQLTRFNTPDPQGHFLSKRRLPLLMRDDYGRLLSGKAGLTGTIREGGDAFGAGLPVVPTRTVALFDGPVRLEADGTAKISFDVPDFIGQLRVMAVAWSKTRVGNAEGSVLIRHPVAADISFPRFLAPRDIAQLTLSLQNLEGPEGEYKVRLESEGAVGLTHSFDRTLPLGRDKRVTHTVGLTGREIGIGTVRLVIDGPNGLNIRRSWPIAVRSPHYPLTLSKMDVQANGAAFTVDPALLAPFESGSVSVAVNYSLVKGLDVPGLLQSLDRYPYGCTEQITSRAIPLLLSGDLNLLAGLGAGQNTEELQKRLRDAIATLRERMDDDGSIGLWQQGDFHASLWVKAQAADFLLLAREAKLGGDELGFALDRLRNHLRYNMMTGTAEEQAYARWVRARSGSADPTEIRALYDGDLNRMSDPLPVAMLGAALVQIGDATRAAGAFNRAERLLKATTFGAALDGYYTSRVRSAFGALALATEAKAANLKAFQQIAEGYSMEADQASTQEKLWMLRAAFAMSSGNPIAIAVNNVAPATTQGGPRSFKPTAAQIRSGYTLTNHSGRDVYRTTIVHGAPAEAPAAMANGYTLNRRYFTRSGVEIDPAEVKQHDEIFINLSGEVSDRLKHQTLLVDMLPAGWEIDWIRTAVTPQTEGEGEGEEQEEEVPSSGVQDFSFLPDSTETTMTEAQDDRFLAAFTLDPDQKNFSITYVVRVVTPGDYVLPAASVEDMYRPGLMARTATGTTRVLAK